MQVCFPTPFLPRNRPTSGKTFNQLDPTRGDGLDPWGFEVRVREAQLNMGWATGLEPAATGTTTLCSTN